MRGEIESHSHILEQEQRNWTAAPEPQKAGEERDPIFEMLSHAEKCCVQKVKPKKKSLQCKDVFYRLWLDAVCT